MLQLQIGFPGGRYFAASVDDPRQPEWPPHPSRVFSALVAAAYAGGRTPSITERRLLQALEAAPPPSLTFPDADVRPAADSYVPVNDRKSRVDEIGLKPDGKPKGSLGVLLPLRQVRQFPAAFLLGEPEVSLCWPVDIGGDELDVLDALAARVTHVGTSHSLVTARFAAGDPPPPARLVPGDQGEQYLRVPQTGRLNELDRLAGQGYGTLRRPPPLCEVLVPYMAADAPERAIIASAYDWVTLRLSDASWGSDTAHTLARALRRAVLSILGDGAPAAVHGHDATAPHLAWLPLADVGHRHAAGRIRGVAVALPLSLPAADRALALAALARLEHLQLPDGQVGRISASFDGPETPIVLRSATWLGASTHWSTVTPVLLDRPPKRQESRRILAAIAESIVRAGFPDPVDVVATQSSDFEGAPGALDIPTRIPRFHARLVFATPVQGPVIAGRWKNFGVGLFRPTPQGLRS